MQALRALIDGYDTGVLYTDVYIGRLLEQLEELGVLKDTAIVVSADHGETLGELNVYGDHHTADEHTTHLPCLLRWPGLAPRVQRSLCYHVDVAATLVELAGGTLPPSWDGKSFARALREGRDEGRDALVLSQAAWTCQRAVRSGDELFIRTYHDGYHAYAEHLLFDLRNDPHEQHDLAQARPDAVRAALAVLDAWRADALRSSTTGLDPLDTVLAEGGPAHTRGQLAAYCERLRATGRGHWADALARAHPHELGAVR
jgi:arylsulfatase A-like enzyme